MKTTPILAAAALTLAVPGSAQAAEALYGVTSGNTLVSFTSDNTRDLEFERPLRGLPAGEQVVGLDVRPSTGQLYALGQQSRIYVINPRTGAARQVGAPLNPALAGTTFGFDFNPTVDRIRITSDAEQNLRVNPDTGAAINDAPLAYRAGDPGAGSNPAVGASAYTNSSIGAQTTTLFDIDAARGALVTQNPANAGTLQTVGALGGEGPILTFDIGDANAAFGVRQASEGEARLVSVNLQTGAATDASERSQVTTAQPLRAIAAAGGIRDDEEAPRQSVALSSVQLDRTLLTRGIVPTVACDEACDVEVRVQRGDDVVGTETASVDRGAGRVRFAVELNAAAREAVRDGSTVFTVRVITTDGAGNDSTQVRRVRSQSLAERRR